MSRQSLIIIDGLNGAGKTTVSKLLHARLKRSVRLSFDVIKRLISDYTPTDEYISLTDKVIKLLAKEYLEAGLSVIVDAFSPKEEFVEAYAKIAKKKSVEFHAFQIEAPHDVRFARIQERPLAEGAKKRMDKKWLKRNDENYLQNKYQKAVVFDSSKLSPEQIVSRIVKDL